MLRATTHGPERCQWPGGCVNEATDPDEVRLRSQGGSTTDRGNLLLLCRTHHDWKHSHPAAARELGVYGTRFVSDNDAIPVRHGRVSDTDVRQPPATLAGVPRDLDRRITLRVRASGANWVDATATRLGVTPAAVWRAMFAVASTHPLEVERRVTDDRA